MAKRTFSHIPSQPGDVPTVWVPPGARGSRRPLAKPPGGFFQQLYPGGKGSEEGRGGHSTGTLSLASLPWSQSFSCTRLSSVMPWAASSARTLSR